MVDKVKRITLLLGIFARQNYRQQAVYRINFLLAVTGKLLRVFLVIIFFQSLARILPQMAVWDELSLLVLAATFYIVDLLASVFFQRNLLYHLPEQIRTGQFDRILTKPVSKLGLTAFQVIDVGDALALVPFVYFWFFLSSRYGLAVTFGQLAGYLALISLALVFLFFLTLLLGSLSFWTVRGEGFGRFIDRLTAVAQFPSDLFPSSLRVVLFYVVPLALLATLPTQALLGRADGQAILAAFVSTVATAIVALFVWKNGLRHYGSASS